MDTSNPSIETRHKRCRDADYGEGPVRRQRGLEHLNEAADEATVLPRRKLSHDDYTVGWVCALPKELAAATTILDSTHEALSSLPGDTNIYSFGNIGPHNVVITCLPSGNYGTVNAAIAASNMARSFPFIVFRLMVGIGGGVPRTNPDVDVRLGDVVVGHQVLQYDLGKTTQGGIFQCTSSPVKPPQVMLAALAGLRARHEYEPTNIPAILSEMHTRVPGMRHYGYPSSSSDRLFESAYEHNEYIYNCDQCDRSRLVQRPSRASLAPKIHYGTIASGNQVLRHAGSRDSWAMKNDIFCFEMEAAGLIDHFPCLVIRGICDYCDSHKNKDWQEYAATVAAAYAKELLLTMKTSCSDLQASVSPNIEHTLGPDMQKVSTEKELNDRFLSLLFDQIDDRRQNIRKAHLNTCNWLLHNTTYCDWKDPERIRQHGGFLWIKGKPGSGKSTMMKYLVESSQKETSHQAILSFFFNSRGHDLEKSTTGLYRSILFQLLQQNQELKSILSSNDLFPDGSSRQWTNEVLRDLIEKAIEHLTSPVMCFIDALDECNDDEIRDMIGFFERLGQLAISNGVGLNVCFSSRHYPYISMREGIGLEIHLETQDDHNTDIVEYINTELRIGQGKLAQTIKEEIKEKASGVFIWVFLVIKILNKERCRIHTLREKLRQTPQDLNNLFFSILSRDHGNTDELLLCFQLMLFAGRPLEPLELHFAILSQNGSADLDPDDLDEEDSRMFLIESSKGLGEVTGSLLPTVQFIHESVKDFLLDADGLQRLWPDAGNDFKGKSHLRLRDICLQYLPFDPNSLHKNRWELSKDLPFLEYAIGFILFHADKARGSGIEQRNFLSTFPLSKWIQIHNIMEEDEKCHYPLDTRMLYIFAVFNTPNLLDTGTSLLSCLEPGVERYGCPLLAAIVYNSTDIFGYFRRMIIESVPNDCFPGGIDPFQKSSKPWHHTSFNFARARKSLTSYLAYFGDPGLLSAIIHMGNNGQIDKQGFSSMDAINRAVEGGNEAALRVLLHYGHGDINYNRTFTPLFSAVTKGRLEIVQLLLETGKADTSVRDSNTRTPLYWAAEKGDAEMTRVLLVVGGADPNSRDYFGRTPLSVATAKGHMEVVRILLDTGHASPDMLNCASQSPLHLAASEGHVEITRLLLSRGFASPDLRDREKRTPLSEAAANGRIEVVKLLLETGRVDLDLEDNGGRSPLLWAVANGHNKVVKVLLETRPGFGNSGRLLL
ncbi:unnamed protein product [Clonostachys rosea]|uniref:NACHT domain-containing protein n=1 Tax=Bionectria ochroleuca TaxID=29856 RepID=A0ABY6UK55_BIOOC|nr:unnamed protein product [Clonostachys rosea]